VTRDDDLLECFDDEISIGGEDLEDLFDDLLGEGDLEECFAADGSVEDFSTEGEDLEECFSGLVGEGDLAEDFAAEGDGLVAEISTGGDDLEERFGLVGGGDFA